LVDNDQWGDDNTDAGTFTAKPLGP
jgi:hypothetical protein